MRRNLVDDAALVEWLELHHSRLCIVRSSAQRSLPHAIDTLDLAQPVGAEWADLRGEADFTDFSEDSLLYD